MTDAELIHRLRRDRRANETVKAQADRLGIAYTTLLSWLAVSERPLRRGSRLAIREAIGQLVATPVAPGAPLPAATDSRLVVTSIPAAAAP